MSPQYVIHVTPLSSGLATGATRSLCSGATDIFTFQDHLTHKMCCINNRLQKNYKEKESNNCLSVQHVFGRTGHKTNSVTLAQDISVEFACIYNEPFSNPNAGILITAIYSPQNMSRRRIKSVSFMRGRGRCTVHRPVKCNSQAFIKTILAGKRCKTQFCF
jgi:hypothetical protein